MECGVGGHVRRGLPRFLQRNSVANACATARALPNVMTQMLLRGSNGVGYTNYPDNVVTGKFVARCREPKGVDVFRVSIGLHGFENMRVAMGRGDRE